MYINTPGTTGPNCGHCPACGRSNRPFIAPYVQVYPVPNYPWGTTPNNPWNEPFITYTVTNTRTN